MTISPKTYAALAITSLLMAGASAPMAQEAEKTMTAPEPVVEETLETIETQEAPTVEIYTRDAAEAPVVDGDAAESTMKVVEEVEETTDANVVAASSETELKADDAVAASKEPVEELVQPEK